MGQTQSFFVSLDTYHDRRTAYTLGVTAAGVQVDFYHPADEELNQVLAWNPVWDVRTRVHDDHWIVEARIPFSQLRFNPGEEQVWGLQADRWTPERNAEDYWCMVPRAETGWASRFGELRGIRGIRPSRRLELLPYASGELALRRTPDPADPFADSRKLDQRAGADLKMGLGPNLTLDATFNPDFGQVEADPAEINLSAFETQLEERRPFFLEGDRLLRGLGPRYYYSRRIGAPPRPILPDSADYAELPASTQIIGAAKLSGRLSSGLSVGALAAMTDLEHASIYTAGSGSKAVVRLQPRTTAGVLRLQQDFPASGSVVGLTLTGLRRDLDSDALLASHLARQAMTGGVDLEFKRGLHALSGTWGFSRVQGDSLALLGIQRSPVHYYQRPDVDHLHLDPGRRSLTGWTGSLSVARRGGRHLRWDMGALAESPGFEPNDLGYLTSADDIDGWASLTWEENQGAGPFRRLTAWQNTNAQWNFGGLPTNRQANVGAWGQLQNYWWLEGGATHSLSAYSDHASRGGATLGVPGWNNAHLNVGSPELLRPNSWSAGVGVTWGWERRLDLNAWTFVRLRPAPALELRVNPSVSRNQNPAQYMQKPPDWAGLADDLLLFSRLDYREVRIATRLRYTFNPRLRVEFYAEPFMAALRFRDPGRPPGARSQNIRRFADEGALAVGETGEWRIQYQGNTLVYPQPNYQFASWRSTFVLRWDWRLGSTLYLVWQQDRARFVEKTDPARNPDPLEALSAGGDNLIALKLSAWLPVD